ncbi:MAG: Crp/Fnr family transcriptional regulator [Sphingomonas sp.]|nr:Crp/Fnr family transcriptional regulator [Sphingomonas sp.]
MAPALVHRLDAFTRLSPEDRSAIAKLSRVSRVVPARRDLIREGEKPKFVHLMVEGWACRYKTLPDGRRQIVAFFVPGDFCDLNVYVLKQMDHSIGAITRLAVSDISRDEMDRLTTDCPRITQALWWEALVNSAIQREWTLNIGQRTAYERIGHLLVELFLRLRSVGQTSGNSCDFPLTQTDLADATGLTAVHVNRTLQELRRDELIILERKRLTIPSIRNLMSASMFNSNYLHLDHEGSHLDANA